MKNNSSVAPRIHECRDARRASECRNARRAPECRDARRASAFKRNRQKVGNKTRMEQPADP
ncbi:MAG: hypothetical protein LBF89_09030 [Bacteroidales bacterium]|nr:hypothetical protein [Bacteroidales bacterium]